jgi:hypothetical protein
VVAAVILGCGIKPERATVGSTPAPSVAGSVAAGARVQLRPDWADDVRGTWQL